VPNYTAADETSLFYDVLGIGPRLNQAIVVIAGGAARHPDYLGDLAGLANERELVVPHLRGVGRSPAPKLADSGGFWERALDTVV